MNQPPITTSEPRDAASTGHRATSPLACSLERVARWHAVTVNWDEVAAHLPSGINRLNLREFVEAAERTGFHARVVKRRLKRIPAVVLPAVLLLKGQEVGVLEPDGAGGADLYRPTSDGQWERVATTAVPGLYTGYAVFLRPVAPPPQQENESEPSRPIGRKWFWGSLWRFRGDLARALPASVLVNMAALAMPIFTMTVYDRVVPNDAVETLWVLATGAIIVFVFEFLLRMLRGAFVHRVGKNLDGALATMLYEHVMAIEMQSRPPSAGVLAAKARGYEMLRDFFTSAFLVAMVDIPISLLMLAVVFHLAGPIGWIPVGAAGVMIAGSLILRVPLRRAAADSYQRLLRRQSTLTETIHNLEAVKAANAQGALRVKMERMIRGSAEVEADAHWYSTLATSFSTWVVNITSVLIVIACVQRMHDGLMTMGGMIACIILAARALSPMATAASLATRLEQVGASLRGLGDIVGLPVEYGGQKKYAHITEIHPHFQLSGVSVAFKGRSRVALKGIDLDIRPGEKWAVLGAVGSGKSTLLRVFSRMLEPSEGQILLNGLELSQYHPSAVRRVVGFMPQEISLFLGTLRENVALGSPMLPDEDILEACAMAGLSEFINHHPAGLQAPVSEGGYGFSGGERQAIGLARCLLNRPSMLLLDEPTASMDVASERVALQSLKEYLSRDPLRTLLVATHKMAVLELVDHLVVLDHGRVLRSGPKDQVLRQLQEARTPAQQPEAKS